MSDGPEWFEPKRYGYGAGLPTGWQGWSLLIAYVALLGLAAFVIPYSWAGYVSVVIMLTVAFTVIVARTTRGGWRWRWGDKD